MFSVIVVFFALLTQENLGPSAPTFNITVQINVTLRPIHVFNMLDVSFLLENISENMVKPYDPEEITVTKNSLQISHPCIRDSHWLNYFKRVSIMT